MSETVQTPEAGTPLPGPLPIPQKPERGEREERVDELYAFKPHPLLPLPSDEQMARDMADQKTAQELNQFLNGRAALLRAAETDPLYHRLRLPESRTVDELLAKFQVVYESGGRRAGKTEDGVPRFLECCLEYGKAKRWAMQDNALSSVANLQQTFWHYLPDWIKALNNVRSTKFRVHYTPQNGFDGLLILPDPKDPRKSGCEIYFLNFTQDVSDFLGWELGKATTVPLNPKIPDVGALLDENCTLPWFENIQIVCATRGAKIHWMYSPLDGITPTIKELKANVRTVRNAPAELLAGRVNVPGLPSGHMPVVQVDDKKRLAIFYRFTEHNPFSGYALPGGIKELCLGKGNAEYTMARAYGYCESVRGRALPKFGEWNLVDLEQIPAEGTMYKITDPGGAKKWATIWLRVCRGESAERPNVYLVREWPDWATYGEWAVTSPNPKLLNGKVGPAQPTIGYGPEEYVKLFDDLEKVRVPAEIVDKLALFTGGDLPPDLDGEVEAILQNQARDNYHRLLIREAIRNGNALDRIYEDVFENLIDPRAARNQTAADGKGMDLITKLWAAQNQRAMRGDRPGVLRPFVPAPGLDIRDGLSAINGMLYFDAEKTLAPVTNSPRFFANRECRNFIWAANNYCLPTDTTTSDDACEDWIDDLRYAITRGLRYVEAGGKVKTSGGGSY
jgi:hypothetical protein